ncbi:MAG TPA: MXAN_5187 C-terminal domain-containing protein [Vicinamibacterales bacterium]|nr:MXAN_5187 C-terminal domain-containing protein [Vicinamibacterales bacterium]
MPPPTKSFEVAMQRIEAELKQLEAEYNMFFAGRIKRPPVETQNRVAALIKVQDRTYIQNYGDRFRFTTLQTRYQKLIDLWEKSLRAKEEGRAGPLVHAPTAPAAPPEPEKKAPEDRLVHHAAFSDPVREIDKLTALYESLTEARAELGEEQVPFHKFADLVKNQVKRLKESGSDEVAFRVAVKDGKVNFTARGTKTKE